MTQMLPSVADWQEATRLTTAFLANLPPRYAKDKSRIERNVRLSIAMYLANEHNDKTEDRYYRHCSGCKGYTADWQDCYGIETYKP